MPVIWFQIKCLLNWCIILNLLVCSQMRQRNACSIRELRTGSVYPGCLWRSGTRRSVPVGRVTWWGGLQTNLVRDWSPKPAEKWGSRGAQAVVMKGLEVSLQKRDDCGPDLSLCRQTHAAWDTVRTCKSWFTWRTIPTSIGRLTWQTTSNPCFSACWEQFSDTSTRQAD